MAFIGSLSHIHDQYYTLDILYPFWYKMQFLQHVTLFQVLHNVKFAFDIETAFYSLYFHWEIILSFPVHWVKLPIMSENFHLHSVLGH